MVTPSDESISHTSLKEATMNTLKHATILTSTFVADIQPALDDAMNDPGHALHEVAVALASPLKQTYPERPVRGQWEACSIIVSLRSIDALATEARWRYMAWDGAPNRCIAEHYRRFCQQVGRTPDLL